jgi:tRNA A37 threonylcarbamoyladenosine modification protein TsaB
MQGLALANARPLVGVSALDAINAVVRSLAPPPLALAHGSDVAAWMDAQRGEVFSAVYTGDQILEAPIVGKPAEILARWAESRCPHVFAGDGALAYETLIRSVLHEATVFSNLPPLAPGIAVLAEAHERRYGPSRPETIRPIYIRRPDAELARDRRGAEPSTSAPERVGEARGLGEGGQVG